MEQSALKLPSMAGPGRSEQKKQGLMISYRLEGNGGAHFKKMKQNMKPAVLTVNNVH